MKNYLIRLMVAFFISGTTNAKAQDMWMVDSTNVKLPNGTIIRTTQENQYTTGLSTDPVIVRSVSQNKRALIPAIDLPISTATQTALNGKQNTLTAGTNITIVGNTINSTASVPAKVFNNTVARSLNSNYTISTTRDALVTYSIAISVTNPLLAGSSTGSAFLEYSTNAGSSWTTVSQVVNASSVGVAVAIALTQPNTFILSGMIPANALTRIRSTTSGTASVTYSLGSETYL